MIIQEYVNLFFIIIHIYNLSPFIDEIPSPVTKISIFIISRVILFPGSRLFPTLKTKQKQKSGYFFISGTGWLRFNKTPNGNKKKLVIW